METLKKIQQFFSYWYVRYLLVTELYMVDTWERIIVRILFKKRHTFLNIVRFSMLKIIIIFLGFFEHIHTFESNCHQIPIYDVLFGLIFGLFWYFNYSIIIGGISQLRSSRTHDIEQIL